MGVGGKLRTLADLLSPKISSTDRISRWVGSEICLYDLTMPGTERECTMYNNGVALWRLT